MDTIGSRLVAAQELALRADSHVDRLNLNALRSGTTIDIASAITAAKVIFVIEGAATLELDVYDPNLVFESSGVIGPNEHGHLRDVRVSLDGLLYDLTAISRADETLHLTFEDMAVAQLRRPTKPKTASRGSVTRAQFIESLIKDVPGNSRLGLIPFESPERSTTQPIAAADIPNSSDNDTQDSNSGGFDQGTKITVKGIPADGEQKRNIRIVLRVADEENAGPKATLALVIAGIGESSFRRKSTQPNTKAHGVFQLLPATASSLGLDPEDTEATARHFLRNGYYKYGGAIKIARENPGWSAAAITTAVEGSYDPPTAGEAYYGPFRDEAASIIAAWNSGSSSNPSTERVLNSKQYQFTRGTDGERESSWTAAMRLAEEVRWRFFTAAGIAAFYSDDRLMMNPASTVIDRGAPEILGFNWDVDHGKLASNVEIHAIANRWSVAPGGVVALRDFGLATGCWLVERAEQDILTSDTTLTLYKPLASRKEPAHEVTEINKKSSSKPASPPSSGGPETNGEAGPGPAYDARGVKASAAASSRLKQWRNPNGHVMWVCAWMFPQLEYAKKHGWSGEITEGWRSRPTEEIYWDRYGHDPGLAARPGTSNHGWTQHPRGAIDTSDPAGLQRALKGWTGTPAAMKGNGVALPRDVVHFSADGS
jgi:hypothetical protein